MNNIIGCHSVASVVNQSIAEYYTRQTQPGLELTIFCFRKYTQLNEIFQLYSLFASLLETLLEACANNEHFRICAFCCSREFCITFSPFFASLLVALEL